MWSIQRVSRTVACSLALCSVVAVAGCSAADKQSAPASTSKGGVGEYDLAALSELENAMPPGFTPYPSEVTKRQPALVAGVGAAVSYGKPFTVDPAGCQVLLKPVDGRAGAETIGIRADAEAKRSITVGADLPVTVAGTIPETGCARMRYTVPHDRYPTTGAVERIAAPAIDSVSTFGLKITVDGFEDPEYFYAAVIDDRLYVNVQARLAPDYPAQPLLPDLLVKAVDAVRGR